MSALATGAAAPGDRLLSLDAFRGFAIAAMLLVNNPGDWSQLYAPLEHAEWHGWTFTDWIFPFFVFISGISMSFSLARRGQAADRAALLRHMWRRGATIILIGLALNLFPSFHFETVRIPGVLQRLGVITILVAPIALWCGWRAQVAWFLGLLLGYGLVQSVVAVPDASGVWHRGSLQPGEDVGAWLDRALLGGHLWAKSKTWDPEGLLSTLPAVASQITGLLAGRWLAHRGRDPGEKATWFLVSGLACLWIAQILDAWTLPINKNLWTPAFVFLTTGWGCLVFGVFYWLLDAAPLPRMRDAMARRCRPLVVFGMNALFLFALSGLVARLLGLIQVAEGVSLKGWLVAPLRALPVDPRLSSLLFAAGFVAVFYGIAWTMWRRGWIVTV
ncbi:heparan-alpha-glucosaminide N-acetyltransferase domain-containing protein [Mitsuaria sp. CC2]|uniref:acyltransferase family protein n=1 Tax=Mitsuaria sp. CC2 TaxID=3029186 RepID=UPI003B8B455A